jgi:hypothetical protein
LDHTDIASIRRRHYGVIDLSSARTNHAWLINSTLQVLEIIDPYSQPCDTLNTQSARYSKLSTLSPIFFNMGIQFLGLPGEILVLILSFLPLRDITACKRSCWQHEKLHRGPFSTWSLDLRLLGKFEEVGEGLADFWRRKGDLCADHEYTLPRSQ